MDTFKTPVITSRAADDDYQNIVMQHGDIVRGIQEQAQRVNVFNQNELAKKTQDDALKVQRERDEQSYQQKRQELEIKRMALSS